MGAFNTVTNSDSEVCPVCESLIRRRIQFKYGDTWQYDYVPGDELRWGGNDTGVPARTVRVLGYPENCPVCDADDDRVFDIWIRDNVIAEIVRGSTADYIADDSATYLVVDP